MKLKGGKCYMSMKSAMWRMLLFVLAVAGVVAGCAGLE